MSRCNSVYPNISSFWFHKGLTLCLAVTAWSLHMCLVNIKQFIWPTVRKILQSQCPTNWFMNTVFFINYLNRNLVPITILTALVLVSVLTTLTWNHIYVFLYALYFYWTLLAGVLCLLHIHNNQYCSESQFRLMIIPHIPIKSKELHLLTLGIIFCFWKPHKKSNICFDVSLFHRFCFYPV